ncbi:MAG: acyl carrier protein [Myxococcota bacterium]
MPEPTHGQIIETLREILARETGRTPPDRMDTDIQRDLGLDSFQQQAVVIEIESHFDIEFDPHSDIVRTVGDLAAVIERCLREAPG